MTESITVETCGCMTKRVNGKVVQEHVCQMHKECCAHAVREYRQRVLSRIKDLPEEIHTYFKVRMYD
jgi:hypothetical protein